MIDASDTPRTPSGYETAARLGNEVDCVRRELSAANAEIERLHKTIDSIKSSNALNEWAEQKIDIDRLRAELAGVTKERDEAITECGVVSRGIWAATSERNRAKDEMDRLRKDRDEERNVTLEEAATTIIENKHGASIAADPKTAAKAVISMKAYNECAALVRSLKREVTE